MTDEQKEGERQRRRRYNVERRERHSPHYQSALLRADGTCNPVDAHFIGRLSERCPYEGCGALRFPGETLKSLCCHGGISNIISAPPAATAHSRVRSHIKAANRKRTSPDIRRYFLRSHAKRLRG